MDEKELRKCGSCVHFKRKECGCCFECRVADEPNTLCFFDEKAITCGNYEQSEKFKKILSAVDNLLKEVLEDEAQQ